MHFVLLGSPGSGKGTQAKLLADRLGIPQISTGDMLRASLGEGTALGVQAKAYMDRGELVPDAVILALVRERLERPDCVGGYILDGFPRTLGQAEGLETVQAGTHLSLNGVVSLAIPEDEVILRIAGRRTCRSCGAMYHVRFSPSRVNGVCDACGGHTHQRDDDREDTVRMRLAVYAEQTAPLIRFYRNRGLLRCVQGTGEIGEVFHRIIAVLGL